MQFISVILLLIILAACTPTPAPPTPTATLLPSATAIPATATFTPTSTSTITHTPTITATATITPTPTITLTPTFDFPKVVVNVAAAHCRYGPNQAYLHAADLYQGDRGEVRERWYLNGWLRVRFDKLTYHCWVAPGAVEVTGNLDSVVVLNQIDLTRVGTNQYGPPQGLSAARNGTSVTISWNQMVMTEDKDRGYFLETICLPERRLHLVASIVPQSIHHQLHRHRRSGV